MKQVLEKEDFSLTFVRRLRKLDPGERARLRRNAGLAMKESHNAMGLFYKKLVYDRILREYEEETYFLVATLFTFQKKHKFNSENVGEEKEEQMASKNFGKSLGEIKRRMNAKKKDSAKGLDTRFERLLDADEQQLPFYMRREVQFLFNNGGSVDWAKLLKDLLRWNHSDRYVQRGWARDYFSASIQKNN